MAITLTMTGTNRAVGATNGTPNVTAANTTGWVVGATIQGTGWLAGTKILSFVPNVSGVFSNNFTGTTGTTNVIASSDNATVVFSLGASGDTATPQNIINLGLGSIPTGLTNAIQIFGRTFIELQIAQGATYDDTEWTYFLGLYSYMQVNETYTGIWRSGFKLQGSTYIKAKGATIYYQQARAVQGGTSISKNSGVPAGFPTNKLKLHWNDVAWIGMSGSNYAMSPQLNYGEWYQCGDIIMDYWNDSGANASFTGSYGSIEKLSMFKVIGGVGTGQDTTAVTSIGKLEWLCIPNGDTNGTNPDIKLGTPNNVPVTGLAPIFYQTNTSLTFIGVNTTATEIWDDYILPDNYPLIANSRNYSNGNRTYRRTVKFNIYDSNAVPLPNVTTYVTSGSNVLLNAVQAGNFSEKLNTVFVSWTTRSPVSGSYIAPVTSLDTTTQAITFRKTGYLPQTVSYNLTNSAVSQPVYLLTDLAMGAVTPTQAAALTNISIDYVNSLVTGNASRTLDEVYAYGSYSLAQTANSARAVYQASNLGVYSLNSPWKLKWTAGTLTMGSYNKTFNTSKQWLFTGSTTSLTVNKVEINCTPATYDDQISFADGAVLNISNNSILTISPTALIGNVGTDTFGVNTVLNMTDSSFVYNVFDGENSTLLSNSTGDSTWNISNSIWKFNKTGASAIDITVKAYFTQSSVINGWTINGTGNSSVSLKLGYNTNNQKINHLSHAGPIKGAGTSNILLDNYIYSGANSVINNSFGSANKWYWIDPEMVSGVLFRWNAGSTVSGDDGFYGVVGFRPVIKVDKNGFTPKIKIKPSVLSSKYAPKIITATAFSTLPLSNFFRDPTFMDSSDGYLPFVDSLDDKTVIHQIDWTVETRQPGWADQTFIFTSANAKKSTVTTTFSGVVDSNYVNASTAAADMALISVNISTETISSVTGNLQWSPQRLYNALKNWWATFESDVNFLNLSANGVLDIGNYSVDSSIRFIAGLSSDAFTSVKTTGIVSATPQGVNVTDSRGKSYQLSFTNL